MKNFLTSSITGNFRTDLGMAFKFEDNEVINVTSNFVSNMQIRWFTSRFPFTCSLVSSLHIEQIQTLRRISLSQSEKLFYPWLCIEKFQLDHTWINYSMIWNSVDNTKSLNLNNWRRLISNYPLNQWTGELDVGGVRYVLDVQSKQKILNILGLDLLLFKVLM